MLTKMGFLTDVHKDYQECNAFTASGRCIKIKININARDVMEPANIRIRRMRISCAKSVGFGMRICRVIKITSYYGYCNSTYLLKIKQLQMN